MKEYRYFVKFCAGGSSSGVEYAISPNDLLGRIASRYQDQLHAHDPFRQIRYIKVVEPYQLWMDWDRAEPLCSIDLIGMGCID